MSVVERRFTVGITGVEIDGATVGGRVPRILTGNDDIETVVVINETDIDGPGNLTICWSGEHRTWVESASAVVEVDQHRSVLLSHH